MELNLKGHTVLITGASKGIGLGIAHGFAQEGCNLRLVARSADLLVHAAEALRTSYGVEVQTLALDLSIDTNRQELMEAWPDIDVLVNNAGQIPGGPIDAVDDAAWRTGWDLKVFGYIALTRFYFGKMQVKRRGVIINIIGAAGERPFAQYIAGAMGNSSLMAMTRALGADSLRYGVRIVGVNPGPIDTERIINLSRGWVQNTLEDAKSTEELLKPDPLRRVGAIDEVVPTVVFLASDRSSYTSGTIVTIDGGWANRHAK